MPQDDVVRGILAYENSQKNKTILKSNKKGYSLFYFYALRKRVSNMGRTTIYNKITNEESIKKNQSKQ